MGYVGDEQAFSPENVTRFRLSSYVDDAPNFVWPSGFPKSCINCSSNRFHLCMCF